MFLEFGIPGQSDEVVVRMDLQRSARWNRRVFKDKSCQCWEYRCEMVTFVENRDPGLIFRRTTHGI